MGTMKRVGRNGLEGGGGGGGNYRVLGQKGAIFLSVNLKVTERSRRDRENKRRNEGS